MSSVAYLAACVIVPALWGVAVHFTFRAVQRRKDRRVRRDSVPPIDYTI